jgi:site-specific recombinase XerD
MKTNFSLLFYLKKPKNYVLGPVPIYLRITVNGERAETTSNRECDPNLWNSYSGRLKGTTENVRSFNAYLDGLQHQVYDAHKELTEAEIAITAEKLKNRFLGNDEKAIMLLTIFKEHNKNMAALIGNGYSSGTLTCFRTTIKHTENYINWKYKTPDIDIKKIDHEFVTSLEFYLRSEKKCCNNSALKYVKNFKKIIRFCLASGWLTQDPFRNYKSKVKIVDRVFLNQDEIDLIANKAFETARLNQVRDIFLFSCFTGLAYADVQKLKRTEVVKGLDGEMWIYTKRQKTDTPTRVPLLPSALDILNKYAYHPACEINGRALPVSTNQKMNAYLKEIASICGINKELTYHTARHTFATTVTLSNGVPIESVSKMLGHTNIKTTQHYAKILDMKVSKDMALLREKYKAGAF